MRNKMTGWVNLAYAKHAAFITVLLSNLLASADELKHLVRPEKLDLGGGVTLSTVIQKPSGDGPFSVVLVRTPYSATFGNDWMDVILQRFRSMGYVTVVQDCRGTGDSTGTWAPFSNEHDDGVKTLEWVKEQEWCNGKIMTFGGSYTGFTQLAAVPRVKGVAATITTVPAYDWYDVCYEGGAYRLGINRVWDSMMARPRKGQDLLLKVTGTGLRLGNANWRAVFTHLPLTNWDRAFGVNIPWNKDVIDNPQPGQFWLRSTTSSEAKNNSSPNLTVSGWYDIFLSQTLKNLPDLHRDRENTKHHVIIGPWGHFMDPPNDPAPVEDRDLGTNEALDLVQTYSDWFGHLVGGEKTGVETWPYLRIFVMGANKWRHENEWPLKRAVDVRYYFHSDGKANSRSGDGRLDTKRPGHEPSDRYQYDPADPVPSVADVVSFNFRSVDQREVETRNDILVYTSKKLVAPLEVTGPVKVVLHAASDKLDTDWTAKLVDVYPDGTAYNLCEGIIRARYRESLEKPQLLAPNKPYEYTIDLWATSNLFKKGHRIRVEISSSNFPRFDRNPNTGNRFGTDTRFLVAQQTVFHDGLRSSHIVLPVVPRVFGDNCVSGN